MGKRKANNAPVRTCVGCRQRFLQTKLLRFVRRGEAWCGDARKRAAGRGAYLCSQRCAARVGKNKRYPGLAAAAAAIPWGSLFPSEAGVYDGAVPFLPGDPAVDGAPNAARRAGAST